MEAAPKANVTLRLNASLIRDAKVLAARRGTSVSQLMAERLEELVRQDRAYDIARERALQRLDRGFDLRWSPPADRGELHER